MRLRFVRNFSALHGPLGQVGVQFGAWFWWVTGYKNVRGISVALGLWLLEVEWPSR